MDFTLPPGVKTGTEASYVYNPDLGKKIYLLPGKDVNRETGLLTFNEIIYTGSQHTSALNHRVNPSPLQQSVADLVSRTLGEDWLFRQIRDEFAQASESISPDLRDIGNNPLAVSGSSYNLPLSLIYQRNQSIDYAVETFQVNANSEEQTIKDNLKRNLAESMNELVRPRYSLDSIQVFWGRWHPNSYQCMDPRYITVDLYFENMLQKYRIINASIEAKRKEIAEQTKIADELAALLGITSEAQAPKP